MSNFQFRFLIFCSARILLPLIVFVALSNGNAHGIDQETYLLQSNKEGFAIFNGNESIAIPLEWLRPAKEEAEERGYMVSSFNYSEVVTAFSINSRNIGLHISSYNIQKEGSASNALGRDVFLILDTRNKELSFGLSLGITKSRGRHIGCETALFHELEIADINNDGSTDIGVIKKEVECVEKYDEEEDLDRIVSNEIIHPKKWFIFSSHNWEYVDNDKFAMTSNSMGTKLPLIDLVIDPVSYVKDIRVDTDPK